MTPHSCGQRRRHPQGGIESLPFYIASLHRLTTVQKIILGLVADCSERGPPFRPSLPALGKLCSCSRRTAWTALQGLDGHHGWIVSDWQGGQKTNIYLPGWRLKRMLYRVKGPARDRVPGQLKLYRKKGGGAHE